MHRLLVVALVCRSVGALADESAAAPSCRGPLRGSLERALVAYCEQDRLADGCTCHQIRRALRCEPDTPSRIVANVNGLGGRFLLLLPVRCKAWRAYFARGERGWRVDHVDDDPACPAR